MIGWEAVPCLNEIHDDSYRLLIICYVPGTSVHHSLARCALTPRGRSGGPERAAHLLRVTLLASGEPRFDPLLSSSVAAQGARPRLCTLGSPAAPITFCVARKAPNTVSGAELYLVQGKQVRDNRTVSGL